MKTAPFLFLIFWMAMTTVATAQYITSKADQAFNPIVYYGSANEKILRIEVEIGPAQVTMTDMEFTTDGTTNPITDISNAKLWYYNDSSSFNVNLATLLGTFSYPMATNFMFLTAPNPYYSGMLSYSNLAPGKNYFWLTYDTPGSGTVGNYLDACYVSCKANAVNYVPTVSCPTGSGVISFPTNISENTSDPVFSIFPVPASDEITLKFDQPIINPMTIELLDVTGKLVSPLFKGQPEGTVTSLKLSLKSYEPGLYLIRSTYDGRESLTKIVLF